MGRIFKFIFVGDGNGVANEIDMGCNVNSIDHEGFTPLMRAIAFKNREIIKLIFLADPDVSVQANKGWSALHAAAQAGDKTSVSEILKRGGNVNLIDDFGNTPLFTAIRNAGKNHDIIKILLDAGAIPTSSNKSGISPLDLANSYANQEVIDLLLRFNGKRGQF